MDVEGEKGKELDVSSPDTVAKYRFVLQRYCGQETHICTRPSPDYPTRCLLLTSDLNALCCVIP
jgi:hypothetical protein